MGVRVGFRVRGAGRREEGEGEGGECDVQDGVSTWRLFTHVTAIQRHVAVWRQLPLGE